MTLLVLIAVGASMAISIVDMGKASRSDATELMQTLASERAGELQTSFDLKIRDLNITAERSSTAKALAGFASSWSMFGDEAAAKILDLYVEQNPFPPGERQKFDSAGDFSFYTSAHAAANPEFRATMEMFQYYDVFLIDMSGNVVYTVFKESDFAANLNSGALKGSGLANLYNKAKDLPEGEIAFEDFAPYGPSNGDQAAFIGRPVYDAKGTKIGVLAYQLVTTHLTDITNVPDGLGESGEAYVVGPDYLMRTDSRFSDAPTAMAQEARNAGVEAALAGEEGVMTTTGLDGNEVLMAYRPLRVFGQNWAIIVERDTAEIYEMLNETTTILMISTLVLLGVITIIGFLFSRAISKPLSDVSETMHKIAEGELSVHVANTNRRDEVGDIAKRLDEFRQALVQAEQTNFESQFRGAAFQASKSAMMMVNRDMEIIHMNEAVLEMLRKYEDAFAEHVPGFDTDKVMGNSMDSFHPGPLAERVRGVMQDPAKLPYRAMIAMGDVRLELTISAVNNEKGEHIGYVTEWLDVSQTYMNNALLGALDENQVKAEFSPDGTFIDANELFKRAVGHMEHFANVADMSPQLAAVFDRVRHGEAVYDLYTCPCAHDGSEVKIDGGFAPVKDQKGNILRIVLIGNDVTKAQADIKAAAAEREKMQAAQAKVVTALQQGLEQLALGNLTAQIDETFDAEYEQLRNDYNQALGRLLEAMRGVVENADLIQGEAAEISNAADDLSLRTEKQAATLEETASAIDELTSSVQSAAEGAAHANELVENARKNAEASGEVVREAVSAMGEIENSSQQIGKITSVIDDIAFQTNLLALNAGVEAARAGEAGRGFAVVASEVRALAQRSSDAAREINELISSSGAQVKRGVDLVDQAGNALRGIVDSVKEIAENVSAIAVSSKEQSSGLVEINEAMNQLDQVTQQNAAMFEETTAASHALTREAETLTQTMSRFQTGKPGGKSADVVAPSFSTRRSAEPATPSAPAPKPAAAPAKAASAAAPQAAAVVDEDDGWDEF
ncbi:MAG: methyl-accepting chemotaxis protein [Maritimibacter sp.]